MIELTHCCPLQPCKYIQSESFVYFIIGLFTLSLLDTCVFMDEFWSIQRLAWFYDQYVGIRHCKTLDKMCVAGLCKSAKQLTWHSVESWRLCEGRKLCESIAKVISKYMVKLNWTGSLNFVIFSCIWKSLLKL